MLTCVHGRRLDYLVRSDPLRANPDGLFSWRPNASVAFVDEREDAHVHFGCESSVFVDLVLSLPFGRFAGSEVRSAAQDAVWVDYGNITAGTSGGVVLDDEVRTHVAVVLEGVHLSLSDKTRLPEYLEEGLLK